LKVGIIGAGNVAWHLIQGFQQTSEVAVSWIYSRTQVEQAYFPQVTILSSFEEIAKTPVDLILLCVNDDSIQLVLNNLPEDCSVAYTSGTVSLENLHYTQENCGVFYPLQTFTKGTPVDLKEVPFLIEASKESFQLKLTKIAHFLSSNVQEMNSSERKQLHIAAVFTNNFVNHLLYLAEQHLVQNKLNGELLNPLLKETVRKAIELGPLKAQSGPARRMDQKTIDTHLNNLNGLPKELYELISQSIQNTYPDDNL